MSLIVIKNYSIRAEAEMDRDRLIQSGIKAMVASDGSGVSHTSMFTGQTNLLVDEKEIENARKIIDMNISDS